MILNGLKTRSGSYGDKVLSLRPRGENCWVEEQEILYKNNSWHREIRAFFDAILTGQKYAYSGLDQALKLWLC